MFKPLLKPENSVIVAVSVAGLVLAVYNMKIGPVADVHQTDAYDGNMQASIKKAGWESLALVTGVTLISRDPNIAILGGAALILEELMYRHALISNPQSGQIQQIPPAAYQTATQQVTSGNVTDMGTYQAVAG